MKNLILLLIFLYSAIATAQSSKVKDGWRFGTGMAAIYNPLYEGDNENGLSIVPDVRFHYSNRFFFSVGEGVGWKFYPTDSITIGPIYRYKFSRSEIKEPSPFQVSGETSDLEGLGDVAGTSEIGVFFAKKFLPFLDTRWEIRQGFGGHNGYLIDGRLSLGWLFGKLITKTSVNINYASKDYMSTYFGVDATQSTRSGLAKYSPDGGLRSVGISSVLIYPRYYPFTLVGIFNAKYLQSEIANSPLVKTRGRPQQYFMGLSLSYEFQFL